MLFQQEQIPCSSDVTQVKVVDDFIHQNKR